MAYIANCLDRTRFDMFLDLLGYQTNSNGSVPLEMGVITTDILYPCILDWKAVSMSTYFLEDITCFEVRARGYVSKEYHKRLRNQFATLSQWSI